MPVEDAPVAFADDHRGSRDRAETEQFVLDAQLVETVGEEAHSLFVLEVGLLDPPNGLCAEDTVHIAVRPAFDAHGEVAFGSLGTDDDALCGYLGCRRGPVL